MARFKVLEEVYKNGMVVYRLKRKHPFFGFWLYVGRTTDSLFFTTLNHYQTAYHSLEEAYSRLSEYENFLKLINSSIKEKRVCKIC